MTKMSQKRRWDTPEWAWEQALIDAYDNYRWHEVLGPLTAAVRRWKAGELDHVDLARAVGRSGKEVSPIDNVFSQKREMLVRLIEFDEEWSVPWSPPTPGPRRWKWSDRASPHWRPYALRCRLGNKHRSRALYYPSCLYSARINALKELRHINAKEA